MALKHFLDTGELPGNILELAVIKKINLYSFVVGDHSCLAELNLADNPIHAKIIDTGTTIKLIKPFSEDGKIIQAHKNFKPLKSKTNILISPSAEELAQFESIEEDNSKINPISPGGGAQSAHTQFKGSKLLFDLETLCMLSEV